MTDTNTNTNREQVPNISLLTDDTQFRCTVCGQIGTVGRCCGLNTREPLNDLARAEIEAEHDTKTRITILDRVYMNACVLGGRWPL